jgi:putative flippase GtrA
MLGLALSAGTVTGLIAKFLLDKHWIFYDRAPRSVAAHGRQFGLYTGMGVLTTAVFWGTEYLFHWLGDTDAWRLGGGALGLAIGYVLKYQLDRRFVFGAGGS